MGIPEVHLLRSGLTITIRCTLKCKLCGGYMPYYEHPHDLDVQMLCDTVDSYFSVVDTVGDFCLTGGEPLMHKDLGDILKKVLTYSSQINKVLILTNGTLMLQENVTTLLKQNRDKCQVTISHYGQWSRNAGKLKAFLDENEIPSRVINYHGEDVYFDGWVDYRDHSLKHFTQQEIEEQGRKCAVRSNHCNFYIMDGKIYSCGRYFRRMELGIIPGDRDEFVDLLDSTISNADKRQRVLKIYNSTYSSACAYCTGLSEDAPRYLPAEQVE